jgi:hypothetical protein
MGLLSRLFGRAPARDGSSAQRAIVAKSIDDEYEWMQRNCRGYRHTRQALCEIDGRPYDVHTLQDARGQEREVFFDISTFFGKY